MSSVSAGNALRNEFLHGKTLQNSALQSEVLQDNSVRNSALQEDSRQKSRGRAGYIDIARGIAIIFVVVYHTGKIWEPFDAFYSLFFMQLFIFISGFVSSENRIYDFKSLLLHLKKRVSKLYFFYVKWELIYLLLTNFFLKIGFYSSEIVYRDKKIGPITSAGALLKKIAEILLFMGREPYCGAFWFIICLIFIVFGYSVINFAVNAVFAAKDEHFRQAAVGIAALVCFVAGCVMSKTVNIPRAAPACTMMICYHFGYLARVYKEKIRFDNIFAAIFSFAALCVLERFGSVEMNQNIFPNALFFLAATIAGIYFSIYVSKLLEKTFAGGWLEYVGRKTLPIIALHYISFKPVMFLQYRLGFIEYEDIANLSGMYIKNWFFLAYVAAGVCLPLLLDKAYNYSLDKVSAKFLKRDLR